LAAAIACGSLLGRPETLRAQTPATPAPAVATPAVETPAVETPAVETPAAEQSLSEAMDLDPGATCLEENRLEAEVQTWLGRGRLRSNIHVHIRGDEHDPRAVEFRILREGKTRERRFEGLPVGCEDATAVVGLAIALAIDANVVADIVAPSASGDTEPRGLVALQAAAGFDVLSAGSVGLAAGLEYRAIDWLSVRFDLLGQFSWGNAISDIPGTFDVALGAASPQLCAGGSIAPGARFELCSGPAVGIIHATGHGYTVSRSSTGSWVVAAGGVRLRFVAGIPWVLDLDGVFPIRVPAFRAEDASGNPSFRNPNPAGGLLSVGPAFTF
jgi:hypothetical protein